MIAPDLNRVIETFIPIPVDPQGNLVSVWQDYIELLRAVVAPLVRDRLARGEIRWYSFLLHNRLSGVPTDPDDDRPFVHLRMELPPTLEESSFIANLPHVCLMTRPMSVPDPPTLDTVDISHLAHGQIEAGWKVLGESSEWVLSMLESHDPEKRVPVQNVAQFLHYVGNQLFVKAVGIPMP